MPTRQRIRPTRAETRDRLLEGAAAAFAEKGFGAASQDDICARVGLTRGAFNSCFASKDELFLDLYDRMVRRLRERLVAALAAVAEQEPGGTDHFVGELVANYPIDRNWYLLNAEFTLYAIRQPAAAALLAEHRAELLRVIGDGVALLMRRLGRTPTLPLDKVSRLLLALHEGNLSQSLIEPDQLFPGELFVVFGPLLMAGSTKSDAAR